MPFDEEDIAATSAPEPDAPAADESAPREPNTTLVLLRLVDTRNVEWTDHGGTGLTWRSDERTAHPVTADDADRITQPTMKAQDGTVIPATPDVTYSWQIEQYVAPEPVDEPVDEPDEQE